MAEVKYSGGAELSALVDGVQGDMSDFASATTPSFKDTDDRIADVKVKVEAIQKATEAEFDAWLSDVENE